MCLLDPPALSLWCLLVGLVALERCCLLVVPVPLERCCLLGGPVALERCCPTSLPTEAQLKGAANMFSGVTAMIIGEATPPAKGYQLTA